MAARSSSIGVAASCQYQRRAFGTVATARCMSPGSVTLWGRIFFETATTVLLLTGIAEPRLATLPRPTERPYLDFLGRCMRALGMERELALALQVIDR